MLTQEQRYKDFNCVALGKFSVKAMCEVIAGYFCISSIWRTIPAKVIGHVAPCGNFGHELEPSASKQR